MDISYILAANAISRNFNDLRPRTVDAVIYTLIDSLASGLAGVHAQEMTKIRGLATTWGTSGSTIWGGFGSAPAPLAAFTNAISMGIMDYEDTDDAVPLHVCSVVLPVLLADIEQNQPDCLGPELLTALAVGIDATMRIGRAGGTKGTRGWNWGLISASMGALLGVARIRRWDVETAVAALGHQLSQQSGSLQSVFESSIGMRLLPGFAAQSVLMSAAVAEAGIDGPRQVFGGRSGAINLYQEGKIDRLIIESGLSDCALAEDLSLKKYPSCRFTHPAIDLGILLHAKGIRPEAIEKITVAVTKQTCNMVGRQLEGNTSRLIDAQFSLPFVLSTVIFNGGLTLADFSETAIGDPPIREFAKSKIVVATNPEVSAVGMTPVILEATLTNGQKIKLETDEVSGSPNRPMTAEQRQQKVADCLAHINSRLSVHTLEEMVFSLKGGAKVSALMALLR